MIAPCPLREGLEDGPILAPCVLSLPHLIHIWKRSLSDPAGSTWPEERTLALVSPSGSQLSLGTETPGAALGASWVFLTSAPPSLAQVKVWFQNRRTKYKRQKLEEEGPESEQKKKGSHHINRWRIATKQANGEDIDVTSND